MVDSDLDAVSDAATGPVADRIRLFWKTGCSSCMRAKEFLVSRAIEFELIDVGERPEQLELLASAGPRSIPVIAVGDRYALAEDLGNVARLLGLELSVERLPPAELVAKQDGILSAARDAVSVIPDASMDNKLPNRDRSYRQLAHHIFRIPEAFLEAREGRPLVVSMFRLRPPIDISAAELADYGEAVPLKVLRWWETEELDRHGEQIMETYLGRKSMLEVLERTVWHSAQHARQLESVALAALHITPPRPLSAQLLAGLPLPQAVYF